MFEAGDYAPSNRTLVEAAVVAFFVVIAVTARVGIMWYPIDATGPISFGRITTVKLAEFTIQEVTLIACRQFRDASGRSAGSETTSGNGTMTSTRRDGSGRVTGNSTGTGKCQGVVPVPTPAVGAKK